MKRRIPQFLKGWVASVIKERKWGRRIFEEADNIFHLGAERGRQTEKQTDREMQGETDIKFVDGMGIAPIA
jgi:hypothetical protein